MPIAGNIYGVQAGVPVSTIVTATFFLYFRSVAGGLGIGAFTAAGEYVGPLGVTSAREVVGSSIYPEPADELGQGTRCGLEEASGQLVTLDLYGTEAEYAYSPPAGWIAAAPQKVGSVVYWLEWRDLSASSTTEVRLRRADDAKWTNPTTLRTATVNAFLIAPNWVSARGADFTSSSAAIWLETIIEQPFWERVAIALDGQSHSQRAVVAENAVPGGSVLRAGHPLGSKSLTQTSPDVAPQETDELPIVEWNGSVEADYQPFASVGNVVDIAPDPGGSGIWILRETPRQIEHRSATGALLESIAIQSAPGTPVGLHILETPIGIDVGNLGV